VPNTVVRWLGSERFAIPDVAIVKDIYMSNVDPLWRRCGCFAGAVAGKLPCRDVAWPTGRTTAVLIQLTRGSLMDALLVLSLFLVLALLAARFGRDSRVHLASTEEAFARQGFTWPGDQS
jgi:hypothetical protein